MEPGFYTPEKRGAVAIPVEAVTASMEPGFYTPEKPATR